MWRETIDYHEAKWKNLKSWFHDCGIYNQADPERIKMFHERTANWCTWKQTISDLKEILEEEKE